MFFENIAEEKLSPCLGCLINKLIKNVFCLHEVITNTFYWYYMYIQDSCN